MFRSTILQHPEGPIKSPLSNNLRATRGRSIIEGDAKWDGDIRFTGEFRYTKGYWEWTKHVLSRCGDRLRHLKIYDVVYASLFTYDHNSDIVKAFCEVWCPLTNTFLTSAEEMSISLWDLHELAGLPMAGCLYDEVVPSALELTGVDEKRERFVPRSSKYLLYAYHLLQSADDNRCSHVSIDKWVKFWSKKTTKYYPPPPRKEKKMVRPKSTNNPLGDIAIQERWSTAKEALFVKLCIERSLKEEVYLAAYVACWLCVFVLPGKDVNSICPSTFKMASLMANGRRVNLAIPVLASIYEGLNTVVTSQKPAGRSHSFPIHFIYAWLACYFKTHYSIWQELCGPKMTRFSSEGGAKYYEPREARKRIHKIEFVSWACNMLVKDGLFRFVDDGHAEELDHSYFVSIKIILKRKKDEDKQVDVGENDPPHALIPPIVIECDSQAAVADASKGKCSSHNVADSDSSNNDRHWKRPRKEVTPLKATEANENASRSSLANFIAELEDDVQSIDVGKESETSHSSTMTPPFGMGLRRKQSPPPAPVSVFKGESFLFNYQKGPSKVEESLKPFFAKVRAYDEARSLSSEKFSRSLHDQQLKEVKARLQNVQAKASEEVFEIQSAMDELEHIEEDIVVLKGRRTSLHTTLKEKKQLNHDTEAKVHEVEKDIAALESTGPLDDAIVENLDSSRTSLDILKEDLKSLNPFV
ncbi:UNVERIFIED_CONTAM: hypothetical protein Scaly_2767300 [Sesamum calycinum]|uniref:Aminotransferase-like plant mobile domain-containing protein n=1 Tax=Sesamum calycinum TaxID=2727403 RepID=A0AAW2IZ01_9LAMI